MRAEASRKAARTKTKGRLQITASTETKETLRLAASLEGMSLSAFVLTAALKAAQEVIESETYIELGEEGSLQVAEALARPARALPGLVDLFRE